MKAFKKTKIIFLIIQSGGWWRLAALANGGNISTTSWAREATIRSYSPRTRRWCS